MATGDVTAVIRADGWSADVTIEGRSAWLGAAKYDCGTVKLPGTLNGTFTDGETVTQATSGATAVVYGAGQGVSATYLLVKYLTGFPDNSHTWTGGTSGKTVTPSDGAIATVTDSKLSFVVTSEGYTGTVLGTMTRNSYGTRLVRLPYQSYAIPAGTFSGTFTDGETVTQATSGATAIVYGSGQSSTHGALIVHTVTGSPDASHTWTGGSSSATLLPSGSPASRTYDERVINSNLVARIALSNDVYDDDKNGGAGTSGTDPSMTAAAGFVTSGGNSSNAATSVSSTNNSTLDYPICIGQWDMNVGALHASRVKSTYTLAANAVHGFGVAAVRFDADGGTSGANVNATVTTATATLRTVSGVYGEAYQTTIALSSFTQGETITNRFRFYPVVGDANSILDTNGRTTADNECLGWNAHTVICDKSNLLDSIKYVETTGNDSTGDGSIGNPYATMGKAWSVAGVNIVYLKGEGATHTFGSTATRRAAGEWVTTMPAPGVTTCYVSIPNATTTYRIDRLMLYGVTVRPAGTSAVVSGENLNCIAYVNCTMDKNGVGTQTNTCLPYKSIITYYINTSGLAGTSWKILTGSQIGPVYVRQYFDGCLFTSDTGVIQAWYRMFACAVNGDLMLGQKASADTSSPVQNNVMYCFNKIINCTAASANMLTVGNTEAQANVVVANNIGDKSAGTGAGYSIFADNTLAAADNVIVANNTLPNAAAANRANLFYNDTGSTAYVHKRVFVFGNDFGQGNIKTDTFTTANAKRTGNWAQVYGCNWRANNIQSMQSSTFDWEHPGIDTTRKTPVYANSGSDDFTPSTASVLLDRVPPANVLTAHDLAGYRLSTDSTAKASVGALQPVPTISATFDGNSVADGGTVDVGTWNAGTKSGVFTVGGLTGAVATISDALWGLEAVGSVPATLTKGGTTQTFTAACPVSGHTTGDTLSVTWDGSGSPFDITVDWLTGGSYGRGTRAFSDRSSRPMLSVR